MKYNKCANCKYLSVSVFDECGPCHDCINTVEKIYFEKDEERNKNMLEIKYDEKEDPKITRHAELLDDIHTTYIQKNNAYGDSFNKSCDEFGLTAALVRMEDKWNRLKNLANHPDVDKGDESINDTLMDLANYCIMTKMWLERRDLNG